MRVAEADKSLFNIENDTIGGLLLETMQSGAYRGTAAELLERLKKVDPNIEGVMSVKRLAKRLNKLWPHLEAALGAKSEKGHGGYQILTFKARKGDFGDFQTAISQKSP